MDSVIYKMDDVFDKMLHQLRNGRQKGTTTYLREIDNAWSWRLGEVNIFTGYAGEGKTEFINFACLLKGLKDGWKSCSFSPENYPAEDFFDSFINTYTGKSTDPTNHGCCSELEYCDAKELIEELFYFVHVNPRDATLENILKEFEILIDEFDIKVCIIDPILKVKRPEGIERDDLYAAYVTTLLSDFARRKNVSIILVMHQITTRIDQNTGTYPKPTLFNIKGGSSYADGVDNVVVIWRPNRAIDQLDKTVVFSSQKIKKQKLVGIPQDITIQFNRKTNRYTDMDGRDYLDTVAPPVRQSNSVLSAWVNSN